MKATLSMSVVALALVHGTAAIPLLAERAMTCDEVLPQMQANMAAATRFCNVFLRIVPQTTTLTATSTATTVTTTEAAYTSTTLLVTPATETTSLYTTTKSSVTSTPSTKTIQETQTSTAYMDPYGSTIAVMKRNAAPSMVELAARAVVTPTYLRGLRKTDVRVACECLGLTTPTYTARRTARVTSTATSNIMRTMRTTTTLATVTLPTTTTVVDTITVIAPSPLATETSWVTQEIKGCPPGTVSTWLCPDMTGDDDGSDPNFKTCAVATTDGYYGNCLYWSDDGSPAQSMLMRGDGSGEDTGDSHRYATYGDDDSDDCPSWADWTCAASDSGNQRRTTLELAADSARLSKRGYIPKAVSHAEHVRQGRRKMPSGLRRGGKYHKSAKAVRRPSAAQLRRPA